MSRAYLLLSLAALSCSSGEKTSPASETPDTAVAETTESCGMKVGETFCDHELMGYVRPGQTTGLATESEYGTFKISDVLSKSTRKYVYVYASAYW